MNGILNIAGALYISTLFQGFTNGALLGTEQAAWQFISCLTAETVDLGCHMVLKRFVFLSRLQL